MTYGSLRWQDDAGVKPSDIFIPRKPPVMLWLEMSPWKKPPAGSDGKGPVPTKHKYTPAADRRAPQQRPEVPTPPPPQEHHYWSIRFDSFDVRQHPVLQKAKGLVLPHLTTMYDAPHLDAIDDSVSRAQVAHLANEDVYLDRAAEKGGTDAKAEG